jgi:signal transduction histidine kinase
MKEIKTSLIFKGILDESNYYVKSDKKRIQQVLLNLLSNAIKFTAKNGKVSITVEFLQNKNFLKFLVTDNGLGIKKKHHKKLFKMFVSIKNIKKKINTKGIGLGLGISKQIVNKFEGEINFRSQYKKGSTFWFTFQTIDYNLDEFKQ